MFVCLPVVLPRLPNPFGSVPESNALPGPGGRPPGLPPAGAGCPRHVQHECGAYGPVHGGWRRPRTLPTRDRPDQPGTQVWLFGRTLDGASVAVRVTGFRPFFYLKATSPWGPAKWASFRHALNRALDPATLADMSEPEFVQAKDMYGFRGLEKETFCRLSFRTEPSVGIPPSRRPPGPS